jgi:tetratricopeptide (TPR) repeat protein
VQATPPLAQVTTSSLEALRAYSAGQRANNSENDPFKAVRYWREAARLDTSFAAAWTGIATGLYNLNGPRGSIDSALEHAYAGRDRLTENERSRIAAAYFANGPHRDRNKAEALFIARDNPSASSLVNAGEIRRSWRAFAAAESLNHAALRIDSMNAVALLNLVQLEINRGRPDSAAATVAVIGRRLPNDRAMPVMNSWVAYAKGDAGRAQQLIDSMMRMNDADVRQRYTLAGAKFAMLHGELAKAFRLAREATASDLGNARELLRDSLAFASTHAWFHGANPADVARIDAALARYPMRTLAPVDRPYFDVATDYARAGSVDKAKAMMAAYRAEVTDTAMLRLQSADFHNALGEVALANDPQTAIAEFRKGDVEYDGKPARECGPCLDFNLARAFDAAGMADSSIAAYERFINTPFYDRMEVIDALGLAGAHNRLGELYEAKGVSSRAISNYERFVELWKNADPELQPLVADARRRLARLISAEKR